MFDDKITKDKLELFMEYLQHKRRLEPHETYWDWIESCLLTEREKVRQLSQIIKTTEG